ncbi:hypothetical protein PRIPAC_87476, partial [Pristionchus pacificus]|uniref:Uncharacterized protein n=1 Tax=Pristionchus pacificus TaxID=54126 RepID=A0A2A6CTQ6_PRIPA
IPPSPSGKNSDDLSKSKDTITNVTSSIARKEEELNDLRGNGLLVNDIVDMAAEKVVDESGNSDSTILIKTDFFNVFENIIQLTKSDDFSIRLEEYSPKLNPNAQHDIVMSPFVEGLTIEKVNRTNRVVFIINNKKRTHFYIAIFCQRNWCDVLVDYSIDQHVSACHEFQSRSNRFREVPQAAGHSSCGVYAVKHLECIMRESSTTKPKTHSCVVPSDTTEDHECEATTTNEDHEKIKRDERTDDNERGIANSALSETTNDAETTEDFEGEEMESTESGTDTVTDEEETDEEEGSEEIRYEKIKDLLARMSTEREDDDDDNFDDPEEFDEMRKDRIAAKEEFKQFRYEKTIIPLLAHCSMESGHSLERLIGHFIGVIARRSNDVYKRLIGMTKEANESDDVSLKLKALDLIIYCKSGAWGEEAKKIIVNSIEESNFSLRKSALVALQYATLKNDEWKVILPKIVAIAEEKCSGPRLRCKALDQVECANGHIVALEHLCKLAGRDERCDLLRPHIARVLAIAAKELVHKLDCLNGGNEWDARALLHHLLKRDMPDNLIREILLSSFVYAAEDAKACCDKWLSDTPSNCDFMDGRWMVLLDSIKDHLGDGRCGDQMMSLTQEFFKSASESSCGRCRTDRLDIVSALVCLTADPVLPVRVQALRALYRWHIKDNLTPNLMPRYYDDLLPLLIAIIVDCPSDEPHVIHVFVLELISTLARDVGGVRFRRDLPAIEAVVCPLLSKLNTSNEFYYDICDAVQEMSEVVENEDSEFSKWTKIFEDRSDESSN